MKGPFGQDVITFLIDRKFGIRGKTTGGAVTQFTADRLARTNPGLAKEIAVYRQELQSLSSAALQALCDIENNKLYGELVAEAEREELARFFNQPHARADIAHWSKAAHWTLDEAIALSFGKAPEVVTWEKVRPLTQISRFALQYGRVRDLALRAIQWKQLYDPVLPGIFVAWVKRNDLAFPIDLEAALAARGGQVADWKSLYDGLERQLEASRKSEMDLQEAMGSALREIDELKSGADRVMSENEKLAGALSEVIEERNVAKARAAELQSKLDAGLPVERAISSRERESLLKLVMGMAIACYKFDPKASRSTASSAIVSDLETVGIALDVDTVRKWLKAAADAVSVDQTE